MHDTVCWGQPQTHSKADLSPVSTHKVYPERMVPYASKKVYAPPVASNHRSRRIWRYHPVADPTTPKTCKQNLESASCIRELFQYQQQTATRHEVASITWKSPGIHTSPPRLYTSMDLLLFGRSSKGPCARTWLGEAVAVANAPSLGRGRQASDPRPRTRKDLAE